MSPLTVTNGTLLLRDGKLGTEQACCCVECQCTGSPPEACEIDYIIFTFEFSSQNCGGVIVSQEFTLNAANGWHEEYYGLTDGNGGMYLFTASLACQSGKYQINIFATTNGGSCAFICDGGTGFITGFTRAVPLPSVTSGGACCPSATGPWEWNAEEFDCFGVLYSIPEMSVVLV